MSFWQPRKWLSGGFKLSLTPKSGEQQPGPHDEELKQETPEALMKSLQDQDPFVRAISADVLGRLKSSESVDLLIVAGLVVGQRLDTLSPRCTPPSRTRTTSSGSTPARPSARSAGRPCRPSSSP